MSQENIDLVRELFERMGRGDLVAPDMVATDIEHVRIGFDGIGLSGRWHGHDGLWAAVRDVVRVFDAFRMEGERFIEFDDDGVFVLVRNHGVGRIGGTPFEQETGHVFWLRGGWIVRWEVYRDADAALKAAGLADEPRSRD